MNINKIANDALKLSPRDRATLAETIWESLEDPFVFLTDITDKEAISLSKQRNKEIEQGNVKPLSHKELMERLRG